MSLGEELSNLETVHAAKALASVSGRMHDLAELDRMIQSLRQNYPRLAVLPQLVTERFLDATPDEFKDLATGAMVMALVLAEYADTEKLRQEFPDMPPVPPTE